MSNANEAAYREQLAEQGVELPEEQQVDESQEEETTQEESEETSEEESNLEDQPEKKRSIYHDLKDTKRDLKTERESREKAEQERDALAEKLKALDEAGTKEEQAEAADEIEEFLNAHQEWNADAIREFIKLAQRGVSPQLPDDLAKDLKEFQTWKALNSEAIERDLFEKDFKATLPALREIFPKASDQDFDAIKAELDKISHTAEFADKDLDYVAFRNKDALSALITPRKRGMESKDRQDVDESQYDFDPSADLSKMSPTELARWEESYAKLGKSEGLSTDSQGRKIFI